MIDAVISSTEENSDLVGLALTPKDAYALERDGKRAIYLAIENGYPIGDDLANIELFFNKGVRYITLVHSSNNDIADSATDGSGAEHNGLSAFGEEVVKEMNRLGIMVDVSHASDDVFFDAIALSEAPIIATHSNARSVTEHQRNMSDEMLRLMAEERWCCADDTSSPKLSQGMSPQTQRRRRRWKNFQLIDEKCRRHAPGGARGETLSLQRDKREIPNTICIRSSMLWIISIIW